MDDYAVYVHAVHLHIRSRLTLSARTREQIRLHNQHPRQDGHLPRAGGGDREGRRCQDCEVLLLHDHDQ